MDVRWRVRVLMTAAGVENEARGGGQGRRRRTRRGGSEIADGGEIHVDKSCGQ